MRRERSTSARSAAGAYLSMLVLLGMVTAGFVLLPLGLRLLGHRLVSAAADKPLVAGVVLSLVGLFYLVVPLAVLRAVSHSLCDRFQRKADHPLALQIFAVRYELEAIDLAAKPGQFDGGL